MSTALDKPAAFSLAQRPDYIEEGSQGHDNIESKDCRPPALRIAQATSPEIKRSQPARYIDGLREGEFFNSLTREILGDGELTVIIVNPLGHRNIEFDKDGKAVGFDIPDDDPRCQFTFGDVDGQKVRLKPKATKFLDYLVQVELPDGRRFVATMSLKSTQLKKGMDLNMIIKGGTLPCYAYAFKTKPVAEQKGERSWYGWLFTPSWPTKEAYAAAKANHDSFKTKAVEVELEAEPEPGEDIPF